MIEYVQTAGVRPWHGDELVNLQAEGLEALQRFLKPFGSLIVDGVVGTGTGPYSFSGGIVAMSYPGDGYKIARFQGASVAIGGYGYIYLQKTTLQKLYNDGNNHNALHEYTATYIDNSDPAYATLTASLADDEKLFVSAVPALDYRQDFAVGLRNLGMGPWVTVAGPLLPQASGKVNAATVKYRICRTGGIVHLRGSITVHLTGNFGSNGQWLPIKQLDMNPFYYPDVEQFFTGTVKYDLTAGDFNLDSSGLDYLTVFGFSVDTGGKLYMGIRRPSGNPLAPGTYTVNFQGQYFHVFS